LFVFDCDRRSDQISSIYHPHRIPSRSKAVHEGYVVIEAKTVTLVQASLSSPEMTARNLPRILALTTQRLAARAFLLAESIVAPNTWLFASGDRLIATKESGRSWRTQPLRLPRGAQPSALHMFASGRGYLVLSHTVIAARQRNVLPYLLE
jgi:hypothetical protein